MATQYKRAYELTIGDPDTLGIQITELNIKFEVTKDLYGFPNLAQIDIFNLSENSIGQISKFGTAVVLKCGYVGQIRTVFAGEISNIINLRQGVDKVTRIFAKDGRRELDTGFTSRTFAAGTTVKQILKTVIEDFPNVIKGKITDIPGSKLSASSYVGETKEIMDKLAEDHNFNWSFQNGAIVVFPKDQSDFENPVIVINRRNGMIGSPAVTEIGSDVQTLLNPDITPYRVVEIQSLTPEVRLGNLFFRVVNRSLGNGLFRVNKVVHTGEFRGQPWYSFITGRSSGVNTSAFEATP